jgi:uncharacterized protein with von Willebrand factor type A (vWA) domain
LQRKVVEFCRALRAAGVGVTPSESVDAVSILPLIDISNRDQFHDSLRAVLVKRSDDYPAFDRVFSSFWKKYEGRRRHDLSQIPGLAPKMTEKLRGAKGDEKSTRDRLNHGSGKDELVDLSPSEDRNARELLVTVYSPIERLGVKKFTNLSPTELPQLRRGFRRLARKLATKPGRRKVRSKKGELDLASTLRAGLRTGGELLRPRKRERAISKSRLVVLCDISGSMDSHTTKLLKILYLAQNTVPGTKVFAFSTRVTHLEPYLRGRSLLRAAEEVSQKVEIWSSGTRIGSALGRLLKEYSSVLRSDAVLMIISDGWEIGDLDTLGENLARIKTRVQRIVWLNPLADEPDYQPSTLGMKTALPYIDILSGLNILSQRREFERVLGNTIRAPAKLQPRLTPKQISASELKYLKRGLADRTVDGTIA